MLRFGEHLVETSKDQKYLAETDKEKSLLYLLKNPANIYGRGLKDLIHDYSRVREIEKSHEDRISALKSEIISLNGTALLEGFEERALSKPIILSEIGIVSFLNVISERNKESLKKIEQEIKDSGKKDSAIAALKAHYNKQANLFEQLKQDLTPLDLTWVDPATRLGAIKGCGFIDPSETSQTAIADFNAIYKYTTTHPDTVIALAAGVAIGAALTLALTSNRPEKKFLPAAIEAALGGDDTKPDAGGGFGGKPDGISMITAVTPPVESAAAVDDSVSKREDACTQTENMDIIPDQIFSASPDSDDIKQSHDSALKPRSFASELEFEILNDINPSSPMFNDLNEYSVIIKSSETYNAIGEDAFKSDDDTPYSDQSSVEDYG